MQQNCATDNASAPDAPAPLATALPPDRRTCVHTPPPTHTPQLVRIPVLVFCLAWASWATVPFMMHSVPPRRAALAVYPVCLLYVSLGWLALTKK